MGCDIHFCVERRVDGVWQTADRWTDDEGYITNVDRFYEGRCYDLFAILADVRNGYGFAGVTTGSGFVPISAPRGLPANVSSEVKTFAEGWDGDGHSHSWLTLKELLDFDWTRTTTKQGYVDLVSYARWYDRSSAPDNCYGGVDGPSVQKVPRDQMDALVRAWAEMDEQTQSDFEKLHRWTYTLVTWETTYAEAAGGDWWMKTIPALLALSKGSYEDVRVVFFFDN